MFDIPHNVCLCGVHILYSCLSVVVQGAMQGCIMYIQICVKEPILHFSSSLHQNFTSRPPNTFTSVPFSPSFSNLVKAHNLCVWQELTGIDYKDAQEHLQE